MTLAILTPRMGAPSEVFIQRHLEHIEPGNTVAITTPRDGAATPTWRVDVPTLDLGHDVANRMGRAGLVLRTRSRRPHPLPWVPTARDRRRYVRFLRETGTTAVLSEYLDRTIPLLETTIEAGVPLIAHSHGYDVAVRPRDSWWRREYEKLITADAVIAVSHHAKRRLAQLGLDDTRIHVVPCGVEVPDTLPATASTDDIIRCLAVGRLVPKKATLSLLEAFAEAIARVPSLRLDIVGDGPDMARARAYVEASGLANVVRLHGATPHTTVTTLLREADIFLQHSVTDSRTGDEEGLPVAILEAMAAGLPVVSTRHAGIPDAVIDGQTGYLVDEGDTASMAAHTVALAADASLRAALGNAAWERARRQFSIDGEAAALRALFSRVG